MTTRNTSNGLFLIEEVTDRLVAALRTHLPGKLTSLNSQYGDDLVLVAPETDCYYTPIDDTPSPLNVMYPSILIVGASVANNPATEGMRGIGYGLDMELSYQFWIFPVYKAETESDLQKSLYRYALAITEVLCASDSIGPEYSCYLINIDYENPSIAAEDDVIRDVPMEFLIVSNESF